MSHAGKVIAVALLGALGWAVAPVAEAQPPIRTVIRGLRVLEGRLPRRALALVRAWGKLHGEELERDWELARGRRPLRSIAPLA